MRTRFLRAAGTYGCTIVASVLAALLLLVMIPNQVIRVTGARALLFGFLALLCLIFVLIATRNLARRPKEDVPPEAPRFEYGITTEAEREARAALQVAAYERYSDEEVLYLVDFVVDPAKFVSRATEEVELLFGRVKRSILREVLVRELPVGRLSNVVFAARAKTAHAVRTTIHQGRGQESSELSVETTEGTMSLPSGKSGDESIKLLIPVMRQRKGLVIDELTVEIDGKASMAVGFAENQGITLLLINDLFDNAFVPEGADRTPEQQRLLSDAEAYATAWEAVDEVRNVVYREHRDPLKRLKPARGDAAADIFYSVSNYLATNYYIFAETTTSRGSRILVRVEHSERRPEDSTTNRQKLRIFLGLGHKKYRLTLPTAAEPASYHFRCQAPPGCYLSSQGCALESGGSVPEPGSAEGRVPYLEMSPTFGLDIAHVYTRNLGVATRPSQSRRAGDHGRTLVVDLRFREIPPGLLGPVALLSVVLAAVCLAVAWQHDAIFPQTAPAATPAAVVGLVFGIPAIMSGWVASRFDAKALRTASPLIVAELATLLILTGLAVGIAAFKTSVIISDTQVFEPPGLMISVLHPTWTAITLLALTQAVVCVIDVIVRHRRYLSALNRTREQG